MNDNLPYIYTRYFRSFMSNEHGIEQVRLTDGGVARVLSGTEASPT